MESAKNILVFSRMNITNFGDPIIGDCCKYLIEKTAAENGIAVRVFLADVYEEDKEALNRQLEGKDAVVFPGGGLNSVAFNRRLLEIFELIEKQEHTKVFFNAIGISRVSPNPKNQKLLTRIFKKKQIVQITTRGDLDQLLAYIKKPRKYPPKLVFDPAVWVNEAYQIRRNPHARKIGIGIIRPEIFSLHGSDLSTEDVFCMYTNIIKELEAKGMRWELFTNGMYQDYCFGKELLRRLGYNRLLYMGRNIKSSRGLVKKIAGYRGIIASRLHANILATSLRVPSVGLVWDDKMNLFAEIIGQEDRYINGSRLMDAPYIISQLEQALEQGYDEQKITAMKTATVETVKNILQ